jgi:hypothetical protein
MLARLDEEDELVVNKPAAPALPEKFTSFGPKWRDFCDGLKTYCTAVRGCRNVPLVYLMRDVEPNAAAVANALVADMYDSTDQRLIALVKCEGAGYAQDNKRLWEILCPLIKGTPAWEYVKTCEQAQDGRLAYRTLKLRGEGEAAVDARRTKAEAVIAKAQYTGKSKRFTLQSYINLLQGAFNDLAECGDPYGERKKVDTFVKGLVSDRFAVVRSQILADAEKRNDFQRAYSFVETMEGFRSTTDGGDGFDRNVSSVGQVGGRGRGGRRKGKQHSDYIQPAEWAKLSIDERKKIQSEREKKGGGRGKGKANAKNSGDLKRKLSEIATEVLQEFNERHASDGDGSGNDKGKGGKKSGDTANASDGPHNQFGRNVHSVAKEFAKKAAEAIGDNMD